MDSLDLKRITAEVAVRHGVMLKPDDPALMLVTISECVLEQCFTRLEVRTRSLLSEMDTRFWDIHQQAAKHLSAEVRASAVVIRQEIQRDLQTAKLGASEAVFQLRKTHSQTVVWRWFGFGLAAALGLLLVGFVIGRMF